jgi:hypothetical protein
VQKTLAELEKKVKVSEEMKNNLYQAAGVPNPVAQRNRRKLWMVAVVAVVFVVVGAVTLRTVDGRTKK